MGTFILIIFMSTSASAQSGTGAISQEFSSNATCLAAGQVLVQEAVKGNKWPNIVWGCFPK